jgi:hypothetical protein
VSQPSAVHALHKEEKNLLHEVSMRDTRLQSTHLGEEIHADQNLNEVVGNQSVFELEWFAVFHEARSPGVDKVEVEPDDGEARHRRPDQWPVICPRIWWRQNRRIISQVAHKVGCRHEPAKSVNRKSQYWPIALVLF